MKWTILGDNNTGYFHRVVAARSRDNRISQLEINGVITSDMREISLEIQNFYGELFSESIYVPFLPILTRGIGFQMVDSRSNECLIAPFREDEIWAAMQASNEGKAPGLDGYNFFFHQRFWDELKGENHAF